MQRPCIGTVLLLVASACGTASDGAAPDAGDAAARDAARLDAPLSLDAGTASDADVDLGADVDASGGVDAGTTGDAGTTRSAIDANRDRLLGTYLDYLHAHPDVAQSNGLRGSELGSVCDLWSHLQPSGQAVFLTITARLGGSHLGSDGSVALDHVTTLYRLVGGQDATATDPGSCGGGEYNRMIMSMDAALHDAFVAASTSHGAAGPGGAYDIADVTAASYWRDSHDLAGPHTPFTLSDETNDDAPRGQVQYFDDPTTAPATDALGRMDLTTLVDPYALEMDQDYDCPHNSNPSCDYTFYGPACFPAASMSGVDLYGSNYGVVDLGWLPVGCP